MPDPRRSMSVVSPPVVWGEANRWCGEREWEAVRMTLAEARAVLNGQRPASAVETGYATGIVLARLDEIERRAQQIRGGLKPYARPVEVVEFLLAQPEAM